MHNAGSIAGFVALIVLGIAAVQALIWIPIIVWWRRKARVAQAQLASAIQSETPIRPPEKGIYRDVRAGGFHPANSALVHELVGKTTLGVSLEETPRWG